MERTSFLGSALKRKDGSPPREKDAAPVFDLPGSMSQDDSGGASGHEDELLCTLDDSMTSSPLISLPEGLFADSLPAKLDLREDHPALEAVLRRVDQHLIALSKALQNLQGLPAQVQALHAMQRSNSEIDIPHQPSRQWSPTRAFAEESPRGISKRGSARATSLGVSANPMARGGTRTGSGSAIKSSVAILREGIDAKHKGDHTAGSMPRQTVLGKRRQSMTVITAEQMASLVPNIAVSHSFGPMRESKSNSLKDRNHPNGQSMLRSGSGRQSSNGALTTRSGSDGDSARSSFASVVSNLEDTTMGATTSIRSSPELRSVEEQEDEDISGRDESYMSAYHLASTMSSSFGDGHPPERISVSDNRKPVLSAVLSASTISDNSVFSSASTISTLEEVDKQNEFPSLMLQSQKSMMGRAGSTLTRTSNESGSSKGLCATLAPDSHERLIWDLVMASNTIITGTLVPLLLVYFDLSSLTGVDYFLTYFLDLLWPLDVLISFRTGYPHAGEVERDPRSIALHYARGWLVPDLISCLPLALMTKGSTAYVIACIMKLTRLIQFGRRVQRMKQWGMGLEVVFVVFASLLSLHFMACGWRVSLRADGAPTDSEDGIFLKYVSDLYWASMTLTSVGYGDVLPLGSISRLFAIIVMVIGSGLFGAIISGCSLILQKAMNNEVHNKIADLTSFMRRREVPRNLQMRVRDNMYRTLMFAKGCSLDATMLENLSHAMQRELCLSILKDTVLRFPLFRNAQRSFVAELAQVFAWEQVLPGDLVTDEGHAVQEVVFVMDGILQAFLLKGTENTLCQHVNQEGSASNPLHLLADRLNGKRNLEDIELLHQDTTYNLKKGAWFGEASLFDESRVYTAVIMAWGRSELALLHRNQYLAVVAQYPRLLDRHQSIARSVQAGSINMVGLRWLRNRDESVVQRQRKLRQFSKFRALMSRFLRSRSNNGWLTEDTD